MDEEPAKRREEPPKAPLRSLQSKSRKTPEREIKVDPRKSQDSLIHFLLTRMVEMMVVATVVTPIVTKEAPQASFDHPYCTSKSIIVETSTAATVKGRS